MRAIEYARVEDTRTLSPEWAFNKTSGRYEVSMEKPFQNAVRSLVDLSHMGKMDISEEEARRAIGLMAVDAAQNCRKNFESVYGRDTRLGDAIDAAKACIDNPSPENMQAAKEASEEAGWSASYATYPLAALASDRSERYRTQEGKRLPDGPTDLIEQGARRAAESAEQAAKFASMPTSYLSMQVKGSLEYAMESLREAMLSAGAAAMARYEMEAKKQNYVGNIEDWKRKEEDSAKPLIGINLGMEAARIGFLKALEKHVNEAADAHGEKSAEKAPEKLARFERESPKKAANPAKEAEIALQIKELDDLTSAALRRDGDYALYNDNRGY